MLRFSKLAVVALTLGAGFFVAGCQTTGAQTPASHAMASTAAQCDKCQVTWVKEPSTAGGKQGAIAQFNWVKRDACPDCKGAVATFFETGKLAHSCKACGGNMAACDAH